MKKFILIKRPIQLKSQEIGTLRDKLLDQQKGLCLICGKPPKRPCLDHEHKKKLGGSGRIRGVLCSNCNVLISKSENNIKRYGFELKDLPFLLRQMADYFERPKLNYMHPTEGPKKQILKKSSYNKLLAVYKGKKKLPEYKINTKKKNVQTLTKPLKILFEQYNIKPEFY